MGKHLVRNCTENLKKDKEKAQTMTSIAVPPGPEGQEFLDSKKGYFEPDLSLPTDYSVWQRKFSKFEESIKNLNEEEKRKLLLEWQLKNPPPPPPKNLKKYSELTEEDRKKINWERPKGYFKN